MYEETKSKLKYNFKTKLSERLSICALPITLQQEIEFPPKELRSFDNYLVAIFEANKFVRYNFKFKDG